MIIAKINPCTITLSIAISCALSLFGSEGSNNSNSSSLSPFTAQSSTLWPAGKATDLAKVSTDRLTDMTAARSSSEPENSTNYPIDQNLKEVNILQISNTIIGEIISLTKETRKPKPSRDRDLIQINQASLDKKLAVLELHLNNLSFTINSTGLLRALFREDNNLKSIKDYELSLIHWDLLSHLNSTILLLLSKLEKNALEEPLFYLAQSDPEISNDMAYIDLLIKQGVNLCATNEKGQTIYDIASEFDKKDPGNKNRRAFFNLYLKTKYKEARAEKNKKSLD